MGCPTSRSPDAARRERAGLRQPLPAGHAGASRDAAQPAPAGAAGAGAGAARRAYRRADRALWLPHGRGGTARRRRAHRRGAGWRSNGWPSSSARKTPSSSSSTTWCKATPAASPASPSSRASWACPSSPPATSTTTTATATASRTPWSPSTTAPRSNRRIACGGPTASSSCARRATSRSSSATLPEAIANVDYLSQRCAGFNLADHRDLGYDFPDFTRQDDEQLLERRRRARHPLLAQVRRPLPRRVRPGADRPRPPAARTTSCSWSRSTTWPASS